MRYMNAAISTVLIALLFSTAGCGTEDDASSNDSKRKPPEIEILDAGSGPKQVLRYKFEAGRKETMVFEMQMSLRMRMGGRSQPTMRMPRIRMIAEIETVWVSKKGDAEFRFEFTDIEVL